MKDAVIVSTARSPIGVAFKGALNNIESPTLTAHAIRHAVERRGAKYVVVSRCVGGDMGAAGLIEVA